MNSSPPGVAYWVRGRILNGTRVDSNGYNVTSLNAELSRLGLSSTCPYGLKNGFARCCDGYYTPDKAFYPVVCEYMHDRKATTEGGIVTYTFAYITRTRLVKYDRESGLFSHGVGVPFAAQNYGLYSTRHAYHSHTVSSYLRR